MCPIMLNNVTVMVKSRTKNPTALPTLDFRFNKKKEPCTNPKNSIIVAA